ncbi:hypothetical protein D3C73_814320 [compost metagenome]
MLLAEVQATARGDRLTEFFQQLFQACATLLEGVFLRRVGEDDRVHLASEVVEHDDRVGNHQQNVRHAQRIRVRALAQTLLHVTHAVITEVAHQAAVETRQAGDGWHVVAGLEGFDEGQRVFHVVAFGLDAVDGHADVMVVNPQHGAARQADDRVTAPLLAALYGLQQVGIGFVSQFQVDRQRRVEVGQGFAGKRDAVVAGSGQTQEFFADHEVPRGLRIEQSGMQTRRKPARIKSGAPTPAGQGLDDFHPEFASDHHDGVSRRGFDSVGQRYLSGRIQATGN